MKFKRSFIVAILSVSLISGLFVAVPNSFGATSTEEAVIEVTGSPAFYDYSTIAGENYETMSQPVYSYLTTLDDGSYMRVSGSTDSYSDVTVAYYDRDFNFKNYKIIPYELPFFGGFYESDNYYFIFSGEENPREKETVETYRLTKYDKKWDRLEACSIYGADTVLPFSGGSCRMTMINDIMFIYTCRLMYADPKGVHHQASKGFTINTASMSEINRGLTSWAGHSFNQFIEADGNDIILSDHGDGNPRAITLDVYSYDFPTDESLKRIGKKESHIMEYPGKSGENYTGASIGAVGFSGSHYLAAGNGVYKDGFEYSRMDKDTRDIYIASVDKSTMEVSLKWITDYPEGSKTASTPHMVKISDNRFAVMWAYGKKIYYTFIDGTGRQVSGLYSMTGWLSDCAPIVREGKIIWFVSDSNNEQFYTISISDPAETTRKTLIYVDRSKGRSFEIGGAIYYITSPARHEVMHFSPVNAKNVVVQSFQIS